MTKDKRETCRHISLVFTRGNQGRNPRVRLSGPADGTLKSACWRTRSPEDALAYTVSANEREPRWEVPCLSKGGPVLSVEGIETPVFFDSSRGKEGARKPVNVRPQERKGGRVGGAGGRATILRVAGECPAKRDQ